MLTIENLKKDISFDQFLVKYKIEGIGQAMAKKIEKKVGNISTFRNILEDNSCEEILKEISGLSEKTISQISEKLHSLDFILLLEELEDNDFDMFKDNKIYSIEEIQNGIFLYSSEDYCDLPIDLKGLKICITGSLSLPRKMFQLFIEKKGGIFKNTLTNDVDILIFGSENTLKYNKAIQLRKDGAPIKLITEKDFNDMF